MRENETKLDERKEETVENNRNMKCWRLTLDGFEFDKVKYGTKIATNVNDDTINAINTYYTELYKIKFNPKL